MSTHINRVNEGGTSIWLDDLSRDRLEVDDNHSLRHLIEHFSVAGVTTNPAIFQQAITKSKRYAADIAGAKASQKTFAAEEIIRILTVSDVKQACDLFEGIYFSSGGEDGRVSIEVDPRLAHDSAATVAEAEKLCNEIARPNVLIKIPATPSGLTAISECIFRGISVNVTLIFSVSRYREVLDAYMSGLERRIAAGLPLDTIRSVASFFVSRVDTLLDPILEKNPDQGVQQLAGKLALANAQIAYKTFFESTKSERWQFISQSNGNLQRPLWASTGVKNPKYPPDHYVTPLIAPNTVNTMPENTLLSLKEFSKPVAGIESTFDQAANYLDQLHVAGIDLEYHLSELERDGIAKFESSWNDLLDSIHD